MGFDEYGNYVEDDYISNTSDFSSDIPDVSGYSSDPTFGMQDYQIGPMGGGPDIPTYSDPTDTISGGVGPAPAPNTQPGSSGSWSDLFTDRRVLGPVLETGLGVAGLLFQNNAREAAARDAREQKKQDALYALEMEQLKYKYGLAGAKGGGGRGGKGGAGAGAANKAALLAAYQNYIQGVNQTNAMKTQAVKDLGQTISQSYLQGRR